MFNRCNKILINTLEEAFLPPGGVNTEIFDLGPIPALVSAATHTSYFVNGVRLVNANLRSFVLLSKI